MDWRSTARGSKSVLLVPVIRRSRIRRSSSQDCQDLIQQKIYIGSSQRLPLPPAPGSPPHPFPSLLQCGEIIECRLLVDSEGQSRQLAFVQFATHADAETGPSFPPSPASLFPSLSHQAVLRSDPLGWRAESGHQVRHPAPRLTALWST
jgi:hypothetical protein